VSPVWEVEKAGGEVPPAAGGVAARPDDKGRL